MKTAVVYARYSSDTQTEQSIEGQLAICQKYAEMNDIIIVGEYIDRAMTGTNDRRPDFRRLMNDCKKKQWDIVLVYKLDRFCRDIYEMTIHEHTLEENGIKLVSAMENIPDTPEGIILKNLLKAMNHYYSLELSQKVHRGLVESYKKGQYTGGPVTYGYVVVNMKHEISPEESLVVKEVFTKYANGSTARAIVKDLKERGVRDKYGNYFTQSKIYKMLINPKYNGRITHGEVEYTNIFPKIIDDALWSKVQTIHESNQHAPSRRKDIFDFILSGKLVCGDCKQTMVGISGTSHTGAKHYYYTCLSKTRKNIDCKQKAVSKEKLEDLVIDATMEMLKNKAYVHAIAVKVTELHQEICKNNFMLKSWEARKAEAEKAARNLITAIEQGIITEQTKTRLKELEVQISQLEYEVAKEKQKSYSFLTVPTVENYLQLMAKHEAETVAGRKELVNTLIREIVLMPDGQVYITFNFAEPPDKHKISPENTETVINTAQNESFELQKGSNILASLPPTYKE